MRNVSRFALSRRALLLLLLGSGAVAGGGWIVRRFGRGSVERYYRRLVAFPDQTRAGEIDDDTFALLMTLARLLLPAGAHWPRYEAQFRWRASNRDGYLDLYRRCALALDDAARRAGGTRFETAAGDVQQRIVRRFAEVRTVILDRRRAAALRLAVFEPEWLLFERYITRDVLALFARSDAWLLAGYPSHPGMARGLDTYRLPLVADT